MRRWVTLVTVCTLATVLAVQPAAAGTARGPLPAANQPPIASAGLDQSVTSGTTVYLDAGGSRDPDGTIAETTWTVRAPNGTTVAPSCRHCRTPTLTPSATGRWAVTVTVTDDDGATASDTLYVTVGAPRGPSVSVTAPSTVARGRSMPLDISATADDASLRTVVLYHDDTKLGGTSVSGDTATTRITHTFDSNGTVQIEAAAIDTDGYVGTTIATVDIVEPSAPDTPGAGASGSGGVSAGTAGGGGSGGEQCTIAWSRGTGIDCNGDVTFDGASRGGPEGTMLLDADGDGSYTTTIDTASGPQTLNITANTDVSKYEETVNGVTVIDYDEAVRAAKTNKRQENKDDLVDKNRNGGEEETTTTTSSPSGSSPPSSVSAGNPPRGYSVESSTPTTTDTDPTTSTDTSPETGTSGPVTTSSEPAIDTSTAGGITDTSTESATTSTSGHSLTSGTGTTTTTTTDTEPETTEPSGSTSYSPGPSQRGAPDMSTSYSQATSTDDSGSTSTTDTTSTVSTNDDTGSSSGSSGAGGDDDSGSPLANPDSGDDGGKTAMERWFTNH